MVVRNALRGSSPLQPQVRVRNAPLAPTPTRGPLRATVCQQGTTARHRGRLHTSRVRPGPSPREAPLHVHPVLQGQLPLPHRRRAHRALPAPSLVLLLQLARKSLPATIAPTQDLRYTRHVVQARTPRVGPRHVVPSLLDTITLPSRYHHTHLALQGCTPREAPRCVRRVWQGLTRTLVPHPAQYAPQGRAQGLLPLLVPCANQGSGQPMVQHHALRAEPVHTRLQGHLGARCVCLAHFLVWRPPAVPSVA